MSVVSLALVAAGIALLAVAALRARAPWGRYRALQAQEQNIARYEAWRGGIRDEGPTGASVAMDLLRGRLRLDAAIGGIGILLVIAGILVR